MPSDDRQPHYEVNGPHLIPGYSPVDQDVFDMQMTCRDCLSDGVGMSMTIGKATKVIELSAFEGQPCALGHTTGNWNVEFGWVGRWDSDDDHHDDDDESWGDDV